MTLPTWAGMALCAALVWLEAWLNDRSFDANISINKVERTVLRTLVGLALAFAIYAHLERALRFLAFEFGMFFLVFDYVINIVRGKPFFYLNDTGPLDKLLNKIPPIPRLGLQFLVFFIMLVTWQVDYFGCLGTGFLEPGFWAQFGQCAKLLI